ncbi:hypothetical protein FVE85_6467 [Porphyridium purpureum]|uniref:BSD domain-containing protein n=1 Tax=Porphyridium purpureum TaxID=35688 RepID=A0A5J4Z741_PORPP|nr:hypothetical protein FVE85_6467 [Porphyridium purpureum]|eukprot:POR2994..scf295_1
MEWATLEWSCNQAMETEQDAGAGTASFQEVDGASDGPREGAATVSGVEAAAAPAGNANQGLTAPEARVDAMAATQAAAVELLGSFNEAMSAWLGLGGASADKSAPDRAIGELSADGLETTLVPGSTVAAREPADPDSAAHMDQAATEILAGFQKQFEALTSQMRSFNAEEQRELLRKQSEAFLSNARGAIENFDAEKLRAQTSQFLAHAQTVVANEGADDPLASVDSSELKAPWDDLGADEQLYAEKMREEAIKLVVDCIYSKKYREKFFLGELDLTAVKPFPMTSENRMRAKGAMLHDKNLARLFAGMVPKYISHEDDFWARYFYNMERILTALIDGKGEMKKSEEDIQEEKAIRTEVSAEKRRDWDTEIDEIFS